MLLRFTKMHGLKNDFAVIDLVTQSATITPSLIRKWADRHAGIGFDQLLIVGPPKRADVDFYYQIFNADGSEVEQCGNGARCFARFVLDHKLTYKKCITVETAAGIITLKICDHKKVEVDMGKPILDHQAVPFIAEKQALEHGLDIDGKLHRIQVVSMGNPHCIIWVDDIHQAPVKQLGPRIEEHPRFPERCNVGFAQVTTPNQMHLRVWERGVGETWACGSGACAAVVAGILQGKLDHCVDVHVRGGVLSIDWLGDEHSVLMTGPAIRVFEGTIRL